MPCFHQDATRLRRLKGLKPIMRMIRSRPVFPEADGVAERNARPRAGGVRHALLALALGLPMGLPMGLTGCHLLDQTDIDGKKPEAAAPRPAADPETRPALVTIEYTTAMPDYRAALTAAIRAVESRRPGLLYDVVAVIGGGKDAPLGRTRAAEVMTVIETQGVLPARIQLGLRLEPGRGVQQVRVYLR